MEIIQFIIDVVLHTDVYLVDLLARYGLWLYAILFIIIFCETGLVVTPFLPGDALLFVAGTLAALPTNELHVGLLAIILIIAAILGDATNYTLGKFFGKKLFSDPKSKFFNQSRLERTHAFYEKYGSNTIVLARFIPIIRTFAPFVAGMSRMSYKQFSTFNVIGGIAWVALFVFTGYFFGGFKIVQENLTYLIILIIILSNIPIVVGWWHSKKTPKPVTATSKNTNSYTKN